MTRNASGATILAASLIAGFGVALVNFAQGKTVDAQTALTFLVFVMAFGGLHMAVRQWAPKASPKAATLRWPNGRRNSRTALTAA